MKRKTSTGSYRDLFSGNIDLSLGSAAELLSAYPASASAWMRLAGGLKKARRLRQQAADQGLEVPPLMIVSTTQACNLSCAGCYSCARGEAQEAELTDRRILDLLNEASGLGVRIVMLAGGEPLLSRGWMEALGEHEEMAGIVFTNGTLFDDRCVRWFDAHRHVFPALSIEGGEAQTDARRGSGVYQTVRQAMRTLREAGIPFGISVTITSANIDDILCDSFVEEYLQKGCRLFVFVEYVPVEPGSEPMVLSKAEKRRLSAFASAGAKKRAALFLPFPGDEAAYGGCLAAGRGFVHISASGDVEPCPFAPFSDRNLKTASLKEALSSAFLSKVRENHHLLKEGDGGCALWHNREWLGGLLS